LKGSLFFLSYYFPPSNAIGGHRILKLANELSSVWECSIYASSHYYEGRYDNQLTHQIGNENIKLIRLSPLWDRVFTALVHRNPSGFMARGIRRLGRIIMIPDIAILWSGLTRRKIIKDVEKHPSERKVIWVSMSPFSSGIAGVLAKKRTGAKLILDFRDPWTISPMYRHGRMRKWLEQKVEKWMLGYADRVLVTSEGSRRLFEMHYPSVKHKVKVITNAFVPLADSPSPKEKETGREEITITYTGSFYGDRQPFTFLEGFSSWKKGQKHPNKVKIVFAGSNNYTRIRKYAEALGILDNIEFYQEISYSKSLEMMQKADVLLLLNGKHPSNDVFIPAKLFDYMRVGKPILFIGGGSTAEIIKKCELGEVAPHRPKDISKRLETLLDVDYLSGFTIGDIKEYSISSIGRNVNKLLEEILET